MKNSLRKLTVLIFALMTALSSFTPVFAEEDVAEPEEKSEETAWIEEGDTETLQSSFYVLTTRENHTIDVPFNISWFKNDARIFSQDLAKLSLGLATAAFRPNANVSKEILSNDQNLNRFLSQAHFDDLRSDDYDKNPSMYTISTVMGHQTVGEGEDAFELIAVGLCGQGYMDEWESNLTIGNGKVHEGFERSSQLVFDRIFGYIAQNHIEGPCKIWLAGFSRAAAVSNLTAAKLVDSDLFDESTVFAYTFATPRTSTEAKTEGYENIFSIVGKQDPVPSIPFAEWGFDRYGKTYFLPTPETDSDYLEKRKKANVVYKELTGIDYWYNKENDRMIQIILAYLLEICPTPEAYVSGLQEILIHVWENRDPLSLFNTLMDLTENSDFLDANAKAEADEMMNYLMLQIDDFRADRYFFRNWNDKASLGGNLLQAHTPELYVSWVFSADKPEDLYNWETRYTQVYITCGTTVELLRDGKVIESIEPAMNYVNEEAVELLSEKERTAAAEGKMYLSYNETDILADIPRDADYTIRTGVGEDSLLMFVVLDMESQLQKPIRTATYYYEDDGTAIDFKLYKDGNIVDTFADGKRHERRVSDFDTTTSILVMLTRSGVFRQNWRSTILWAFSLIMLVLSVLLFLMIYTGGRVRFSWKKKKGWLPPDAKYRILPTICTVAIFWLFLIMQVYRLLLPESYDTVHQFKIIIGILAGGTALVGYLQTRTRYSMWIMISLMTLCLADIVITKAVLDGGIIFSVAYCLLTYSFIREESFDKWQFVILAILLILNVIIVLTLFDPSMNLFWPALGFMVITSVMVAAAVKVKRRTLIATVLLVLGGLLTIYNQVYGEPFVRHIIALGMYYAGIALLASTCMKQNVSEVPPYAPKNIESEETAS